jgi:hypothetical protein
MKAVEAGILRVAVLGAGAVLPNAYSTGIVTTVDREAERTRLQGCADRLLKDARESGIRGCASIAGGVIEMIEIAGPDDNEIIGLVAQCYDMTPAEAIERLASIDFARARAELA